MQRFKTAEELTAAGWACDLGLDGVRGWHHFLFGSAWLTDNELGGPVGTCTRKELFADPVRAVGVVRCVCDVKVLFDQGCRCGGGRLEIEAARVAPVPAAPAEADPWSDYYSSFWRWDAYLPSTPAETPGNSPNPEPLATTAELLVEVNRLHNQVQANLAAFSQPRLVVPSSPDPTTASISPAPTGPSSGSRGYPVPPAAQAIRDRAVPTARQVRRANQARQAQSALRERQARTARMADLATAARSGLLDSALLFAWSQLHASTDQE